MGRKILWPLLLGAATLLALGTPEERGKQAFEKRCTGCHGLDNNKEGPQLRGVFGRKAASIDDFDYSSALKKSGIRWDEASLERWLANPDAMVPDTDMAFHLADGDERKVVIAYLKSLSHQK